MSKPTGQRWTVRDDHTLNALHEWLKARLLDDKPVTLQVMGEDRTMRQNAMINALYGDIARAIDGKTVLDVRCECKLHYGIGILKAASPAFCTMYDDGIKNNLTYEDKLKLMNYMDVTSLFTKEQASDYIDTIIQQYGEQGVPLADPRLYA